MINELVLIGRLNLIGEDNVEIITQRQYKNKDGIYENDYFTIWVNGSLMENLKKYCNKGDLLATKCRLETELNNIKIIATKLTFLASKNNERNSD